jgi:hypothetical protein
LASAQDRRRNLFDPLHFSTCCSLLLVAKLLPLAVFIDELVTIDRRGGTRTGARTVTKAKTPLSPGRWCAASRFRIYNCKVKTEKSRCTKSRASGFVNP